MKKIIFLFFIVISIVLSGCATSKISMNYQKMIARTAGDVTTIVALETSKIEKDKLQEIAQKIADFGINTDFSLYTNEKIKEKLCELAKDNEKICAIIEKVIDRLPQEIDPDNLQKIVLSFSYGMFIGLDSWTEEDSKN